VFVLEEQIGSRRLSNCWVDDELAIPPFFNQLLHQVGAKQFVKVEFLHVVEAGFADQVWLFKNGYDVLGIVVFVYLNNLTQHILDVLLK
jgi:hypothetical protein